MPETPHAFNGDVLLTFKETMGYLRVSRSTLYRLLRSGELTGRKVGCTWRFSQQDVLQCAPQSTPKQKRKYNNLREVT